MRLVAIFQSFDGCGGLHYGKKQGCACGCCPVLLGLPEENSGSVSSVLFCGVGWVKLLPCHDPKLLHWLGLELPEPRELQGEEGSEEQMLCAAAGARGVIPCSLVAPTGVWGR